MKSRNGKVALTDLVTYESVRSHSIHTILFTLGVPVMKIAKLANRRMKQSIQAHRIIPRSPAEERDLDRRIAKAVAYLRANRKKYSSATANAMVHLRELKNGILAG